MAAASQSPISRANVLGVGISAVTLTQTLELISGWIERRQRARISMCTVHTVMECRRNAAVRRAINRADLATPDGMPLVWLSRWRSRTPVTRVYGPDLMLALCRHSVAQSYTHYFYGGAPGVPEQLADTLRQRFPGLPVAGCYAPPFRPLTPAEDHQIVMQLNQARPDIIWVGLGTPKQDLWMAAHRAYLATPVLIGVGAAFDFHTGRIRQAPRWMQQTGLEWFFRLWQEPRRLWHRYLVYNPLFVLLTLLQASGLKKHPLDAG